MNYSFPKVMYKKELDFICRMNHTISNIGYHDIAEYKNDHK